MGIADVEALRGFADHLIGDAVHLQAFRANGVDIAEVVRPGFVDFFGHDFVLAAIAADFEGGGVTEGGEQRVSASVL